MAEKHHVKGYEGFVTFIEEFEPEGKIVNVLFSGEKDDKVRQVIYVFRLLCKHYFIKG